MKKGGNLSSDNAVDALTKSNTAANARKGRKSRSASRAGSRGGSRASSPAPNIALDLNKVAEALRKPKMELSHRVLGEDGNPLMVFLAGFPDHETSAFDKLIQHFSAKYKIIACCLPGMGESLEDRDPSKVGYGYKFSDVCMMLNEVIEKNVSSRDQKIILVGHDWGSYISAIYQNLYPSRVSKIVLYDVAMFADGTSVRPLKDMIITLLYQGWFALSFFLSKIFTPLGNFVFIMYFALLRFFPFLIHVMCPTMRGDRPPRKTREISVSMAWPYFSLFRYIAFDKTMRPTIPTCPTLYIYGKNKNIMFHNCLEDLVKRSDCLVIGLLCGHWVMIEKSTVCIDIMEDYLFLHNKIDGSSYDDTQN